MIIKKKNRRDWHTLFLLHLKKKQNLLIDVMISVNKKSRVLQK